MVNSKYHILKEYANGVMDEKGRFYPFTANSANAAPPSAKEGIRYYLKSVCLSKAKAGALAATTAGISCMVNGASVNIAYISLPETFAASNDVSNISLNLGLLCDINTTWSTSDYHCIVYAEITEQAGEYLQ